MRVLIINNHTKHLDALATLFLNADIIDKNDLREDINYSSYDLVVISGGSGIPTVLDYPDEYNFESKLITETSRPVLGICLGSEIITYAFGGILQKLEMTHKGIIELDILDKNLKKILGSNFINVHESHKIGIKQIPKNFIVCATSEHGVEIIKQYKQGDVVRYKRDEYNDKKPIGEQPENVAEGVIKNITDEQKEESKKKSQQKYYAKNKDKDQKKDQDQKNDQSKDQQPQKPESQPSKLSKQQADQLLDALQQEEKKLQDKMKKEKGNVVKMEKDW